MNKKVKLLIILAFLFIVVIGGSYSYSMYKSSIAGNASADVAKWNITVNGCNIVNPDETNTDCFASVVDGDTVTVTRNFKVDEFVYEANGNKNVIPTKIAPGSSGSFKVRIRPNDTEVSFKYTFRARLADTSNSIKLYVTTPTNSTKTLLSDAGYEGTINYAANHTNYEEVFTIYVEWVNDNTGQNDERDTEIGTQGSDPRLSIPIEIVFEQIK